MLINFHPHAPTLFVSSTSAFTLSTLCESNFYTFLFGFSNICVFIMYALHIKTSQIDMCFTIIFSVFLAFLSIFSPSYSTSPSLEFTLSLPLSLSLSLSYFSVCCRYVCFLFDVISLYFLFFALSLLFISSGSSFIQFLVDFPQSMRYLCNFQ